MHYSVWLAMIISLNLTNWVLMSYMSLHWSLWILLLKSHLNFASASLLTISWNHTDNTLLTWLNKTTFSVLKTQLHYFMHVYKIFYTIRISKRVIDYVYSHICIRRFSSWHITLWDTQNIHKHINNSLIIFIYQIYQNIFTNSYIIVLNVSTCKYHNIVFIDQCNLFLHHHSYFTSLQSISFLSYQLHQSDMTQFYQSLTSSVKQLFCYQNKRSLWQKTELYILWIDLSCWIEICCELFSQIKTGNSQQSCEKISFISYILTWCFQQYIILKSTEASKSLIKSLKLFCITGSQY